MVTSRFIDGYEVVRCVLDFYKVGLVIVVYLYQNIQKGAAPKKIQGEKKVVKSKVVAKAVMMFIPLMTVSLAVHVLV